MLFLERRRHIPGCFADDFDLPFDGRPRHQVVDILLERTVARVKSTTARAAVSMSQRYDASACSRGIEHLVRSEEFLTTKRVAQRFLLDEVDLASEQLLELILHRHEIPEAPRRIGFEAHEHVQIAVRTVVCKRKGSKEGYKYI